MQCDAERDPLLWNGEPVSDDEFFDRLIRFYDLKQCPVCGDVYVSDDDEMQRHFEKDHPLNA